MKIILKNSSLLFQKFRVNEDIVFNGTMTSSNDNGETKTVDLQQGNYLITMPEELWSLDNYHSSYIFRVVVNSDEIIYSIIGTNIGVGTEYEDINYANIVRRGVYITVEEGDVVSLFVRADEGHPVAFHIENVKSLDEIASSVYYQESITFTQGTGIYNKTTPSSFDKNYIYFLDNSLETYVKYAGFNLSKQPSGNNVQRLYCGAPYFIPIGTGNVVSEKWSIGGNEVIGSGTADFIIRRIPLNAIKY